MSASKPNLAAVRPSSRYRLHKEWFIFYGFNETQAGALARREDVDPYVIARALDGGCTIDLAMKIFL